jgi:hypothetical protein
MLQQRPEEEQPARGCASLDTTVLWVASIADRLRHGDKAMIQLMEAMLASLDPDEISHADRHALELYHWLPAPSRRRLRRRTTLWDTVVEP